MISFSRSSAGFPSFDDGIHSIARVISDPTGLAAPHLRALRIEDAGSSGTAGGSSSSSAAVSMTRETRDAFGQAKIRKGVTIRVSTTNGAVYGVRYYPKFGFLATLERPVSGTIQVVGNQGILNQGSVFLREGDVVRIPGETPYRFELPSPSTASFPAGQGVGVTMPASFTAWLAQAFLQKGNAVAGELYGVRAEVKFDGGQRIFAWAPPAPAIRMAFTTDVDQRLFDRTGFFRCDVKDAIVRFGSGRPFFFDPRAVSDQAKKLRPKESILAKASRHLLARDTPTHYLILGLNRETLKSHAELKAAYRAACRENHPDRNLGSTDAADITSSLNTAYRRICEARGWKTKP